MKTVLYRLPNGTEATFTQVNAVKFEKGKVEVHSLKDGIHTIEAEDLVRID